MVSELKLFDLLSAFGIFYLFRNVVWSDRIKKDSVTSWSYRVLYIAFYGVIITFIRYGDPLWMAVVLLRYFRFFVYIIIFIVLKNLNLSQIDLAKLIAVIFYAIFLQAAIITLQHLGLLPILWPSYELHESDIFSGTLGLNHVNNVSFMIIGIAVGIAKLQIDNYGTIKKINLIITLSGICMMISSMFLGEARSSLLCLCVFSLFLVKKIKGVVIIAGVIVIGLLLSSYIGVDIIEQGKHVFDYRLVRKIDNDRNNSSPMAIENIDNQRVRIWKTTIYYLIEYPNNLLFGTGFQNFKRLSRNYKKELPNKVFGVEPQNASSGHNLYIHVLSELGIVGLVIFIRWLIELYRSIKETKKLETKLADILFFPGIACLFSILSLTTVNEVLYCHRNVPGFLGFFLSYIALITHQNWIKDKIEI